MYLISAPSQLWKLFENGTLKNKGSGWEPYGNWIFTNATERNRQNEKWIRIKDRNYGGFLMVFGSKAVANETVEGKPGQLWKKGQPNNEGYYTLQNSKLLKLLTADTNRFELKGKCIINSKYLFYNLAIGDNPINPISNPDRQKLEVKFF